MLIYVKSSFLTFSKLCIFCICLLYLLYFPLQKFFLPPYNKIQKKCSNMYKIKAKYQPAAGPAAGGRPGPQPSRRPTRMWCIFVGRNSAWKMYYQTQMIWRSQTNIWRMSTCVYGATKILGYDEVFWLLWYICLYCALFFLVIFLVNTFMSKNDILKKCLRGSVNCQFTAQDLRK